MSSEPLLPISQPSVAVPASPAQSPPPVDSFITSSPERQPFGSSAVSSSPTSSATGLPSFPRRQPAPGPARSDKAKGKQRDHFLARDDTRRPERQKGRQVTIRFLEGGIVATAADSRPGSVEAGDGERNSGDLELWAEEADSIADLKWKVRQGSSLPPEASSD